MSSRIENMDRTYHVMKLIQLSEEPDWAFLKMNRSKIAFLFGSDDHWGPLHMFEEVSSSNSESWFEHWKIKNSFKAHPIMLLFFQISDQVPEIALSIEREGHTHAFSCTEAGASWVAQYVASLTKDKILSSDQLAPILRKPLWRPGLLW